MNTKLLQQRAILFSLSITMIMPCAIKSMKRSMNTTERAEDSKRQKVTTEPLSFTDLPVEMQEKIITASSNKSNIGVTSTKLKALATKNNTDLMLKNPLHLTEKNYLFQFVRALNKEQINITDNLEKQYPNGANMARQIYSIMNDLARAAYSDDINEVDRLIREGRYNSAGEKSSENAIIFAPAFIAVNLGHIDLLDHLLKNYPKLLQEKTTDDYSLLHIAAQNEFPEITQFLLKNTPLDVNATTEIRTENSIAPLKFTPLQLASHSKQTENIKLFLENGATIKPPNSIFEAIHYHPAFIATKSGDLATLQFLKQYGQELLETITPENYSLLHCAAEVTFPHITNFY